MAKKLESYNQDHLPGGRYHNPCSETRDVLSSIKPHNDQTESTFGVNNWLSRIFPNMSQVTRSVMVEFSVNDILYNWLDFSRRYTK